MLARTNPTNNANASHTLPPLVDGIKEPAREMPIDTAVAAIINDTASDKVMRITGNPANA